MMVISTEESRPKTGEARLVGGFGSAGILEMWYDGKWRTVCRDSVDNSEANLICRHLKFLPIGEQLVLGKSGCVDGFS